AVFGKTPRQRPDELAIGIAAQHFEAREAACAQAGAVGLDGVLLRVARSDLPSIFSKAASNRLATSSAAASHNRHQCFGPVWSVCMGVADIEGRVRPSGLGQVFDGRGELLIALD